jgi:NTE family protein
LRYRNEKTHAAPPNAVSFFQEETAMPKTPPAAPVRERAKPAAPATHALKRTHKVQERPPFGCIALLLQGGGALGAYQAGVYEALAEAGLGPDWVAGTSIGAINAAIIAGNPPEARVAKLREFWNIVTRSRLGFDNILDFWLAKGEDARSWANSVSANTAAYFGVTGFYAPRFPSALFQPPGTVEATSFYDTKALKATLEGLVDFDHINSERTDVRLSLGSVNVRSGKLVYFDNKTDIIRPEHVMASGALPPGFPAVEIGGQHYWDGGVVSNTPLMWAAQQMMAEENPPDTLAFQVDLWATNGNFPRNVREVLTRTKAILNSSRTAYFTDFFRDINKVNSSLARFLAKVPAELKKGEDAEYLMSVAKLRVHHLVNLVYQPEVPEDASMENEFSHRSMEDRWRAGYDDTVYALRHPEIVERRPGVDAGIFIFNFPRGRE